MTNSPNNPLNSEFFSEADELISEINNGLIEIDKHDKSQPVNQQSMNALFRAAHSLKGLAGMAGLNGVSRLSHSLENVMDKIRKSELEISDEVTEILFSVSDQLGEAISIVSRTGKEPGNLVEMSQGVIKELETLLKSQKNVVEIPVELEEFTGPMTDYELARLRANISQNISIYLIDISIPIMSLQDSMEKVAEAINNRGEQIAVMPSHKKAPSADMLRFSLIVSATPEVFKEIEKNLSEFKADTKELYVSAATPLKPAPAEVKEPKKTIPAEAPTKRKDLNVSTVRVNTDDLNTQMAVLGELIILNEKMQDFLSDIIRNINDRRQILQYHRFSRDMKRYLLDLQWHINQTRMIPIGTIFNRFYRQVKSTSKKQNKFIQLIIKGEDTNLDKSVIELLADPMTHIIRNSIDHGLETPEEREKTGKSREGKLQIEAFRAGNTVKVRITDDGRGIDIEKVKNKAVSLGLLAPDTDSEEEIISAIFEPGFSTAAKVTELSGRGVGLDVVSRNIKRIRGKIEVETRPGTGSTFQITIPISLMLIKALIIEIDNHFYAIPSHSISQITKVDADDFEKSDDEWTINLREETIPVYSLRQLLNGGIDNNGRENKLPEMSDNKVDVVVVGSESWKAGILVEKLLKQFDIIIKPLDEEAGKIKGIAGAAELSSGGIAIILDIESLLGKSFV